MGGRFQSDQSPRGGGGSLCVFLGGAHRRGRNKGLDLSGLMAVPQISYVIAMGEAAGELEEAAGDLPIVRAATMDEAVTVADRIAKAGDTVLLAPGCASFDMFRSYADRGNRFADAVRRRKEGR